MNGTAAYNVGYSVGSIVGFVLVMTLPIAIGVFASRRLNRNRDYSSSVRWPTYVGVTVSAVLLLGQCSGTTSNAQSLEINHG